MPESNKSLIRYINRLPLAGKAFLLIVVVPTMIATIYYGLIASDIYISEARYAIRANSDIPAMGLIDSIFGSAGSSSSGDDSFIVRDYILSRDMLEKLNAELDLKSHYQSNNIDILSRLDRDASMEEFYEYYLDLIKIRSGSNASISTLEVRAFTAEFAQQIALLIIINSEQLVNQMANRIIEDTLKFARNEVAVRETLIRKASDEISRFRNKSKSIDPAQETRAVLGIVTGLESILAQTKAELIEAESYMTSDSPSVKNIRSKVNALKQQIINEKLRLATEEEGIQDYTKLIYDYEPLQLNKLLAEQQYASALTSLEVARIEAQRKQRYLITFVTPRIPDDAVEPERFMQVLTVFFASLLTYLIGGLIWAAVKDHMRN